MTKYYFRSLRPKQWIKNLFIFATLFFSKNLFDQLLFLKFVSAFVLFSLLSSSVYLINDILDLEKDKLHPQKKKRPIADGKVSVRNALLMSILLVVISLSASIVISVDFFLISLFYLLLNVLYSFFLKKIVIVDVFSIAIGFVIRVLVGSAIAGIYVSNWLIICTFMLSLFLGFTKRRHELISLDKKADLHRSILSEYNTYFLDQMISVVTASTVVFYILYTVSPETVSKFQTTKMLYSVIFVIYGIFRYLYLVHKKDLGGNPTITLITDIPLMVSVILWIIFSGIIIYV